MVPTNHQNRAIGRPWLSFLRFWEVLKGCVFWWVFGLAKILPPLPKFPPGSPPPGHPPRVPPATPPGPSPPPGFPGPRGLYTGCPRGLPLVGEIIYQCLFMFVVYYLCLCIFVECITTTRSRLQHAWPLGEGRRIWIFLYLIFMYIYWYWKNYIYIYVYMYIYILIFIFIYIYICICIYSYILHIIYINKFIRMLISIYLYI